MPLSKYSTIALLKELINRYKVGDAPTKTVRYGKHFASLIPIGADNTCELTFSDEDYEALNVL